MTPGSSTVKALLIEDNPFDAELIEHELRASGLDVLLTHAEDRDGFIAALSEEPDVVLIDYNLPAFDVFSAMDIARDRGDTMPFIVVTGYSGDEVAAECIKRGAADYVLKDQLRRLPAAMTTALEQHHLREVARKAEAEIFASEALKSAILDSALDCVVGMDRDGRIIDFNPAAERTFGYSRDEALGQEVAELMIPPRLRERHREGLRRLHSTRQSRVLGQRIEIEAMRKDGTEFSVELAITEVHLPEGNVFTAVIRDISTRLEMERSLRESEERFRSLVQNSRDVIAVIDEGAICRYVSPAAEAMTGFVPEEVIGTSGLSYVHPDDAEALARELAAVMAAPDLTRTAEARMRTKAGDYIWIEFRAANRLHDPVIRGIVLNYHDVTQRKAAADQIRRSQESMAEAQAISHIGSFQFDVRSGVAEWSDEQYRIFGYKPGSVEPTYETFMSVVHPDDRAQVEADYRSFVAEGVSSEYEFRIRRDDGSERWVHGRLYTSMENGELIGVYGTNQDVTERRIAEQERLRLVERERQLDEQSRLLLESTGEGMWGLDEDGRCTFVNSAAAAALGYQPEELLGQFLHEMTHHTRPDGSPYPVEECPTYLAIKTGVATRSASELFWRSDGTPLEVDYSAYPILKGGNPCGAVVSFKDVTERVQMAEALRSSEALFRGAFTAAQTGIALIDAATNAYVDINQRLCDMLGYSRNELMSLDWVTITHADDRPRALAETEVMASGREDVAFVTKRYVRKDGHVLNVEISDAIVRDSAGTPRYFVTHVVDATDRLAAEKKLRESQELLQGVIDNSPAMIHVKNADGVFILANERFAEDFGIDREEIRGKTAAQLMPAATAETVFELDRQVLAEGHPVETEERVLHADGSVHTYLSVRFPLFDREGLPYALCGISTDITDRVKAEEERTSLEGQLRQAQKMEAVGQLAGGVAHDFNNILAVILNYAAFVAEDLPPNDPRAEDLQEIVNAGQRATKLVQQLLAFSRKEVIEEEVVDLNDVVDGLRELLRRSIGEDVTLETRLDPSLWAMKADAGQLERVLVNLAVNSRDAMPDGGKLTITTSNRQVAERELPGLRAGLYVVLEVGDDGTGMDEATVDRIFEPFFTTKPRGEGTGLGLATVYGIAKQSRGGVYVESEVGRGTTFFVYLPASEERSVAPDAPDLPRAPQATGRVLVVEDDDSVRDLVCRILTRDGFEVAAWDSGVRALEYCREHPGGFDLLLTDVVMPEMSGKTLADGVTALDPEVKVLFMSGYTDEIIAKRGVLEGGQQLINKPFDGTQLVSRVREVLTEGSRT